MKRAFQLLGETILSSVTVASGQLVLPRTALQEHIIEELQTNVILTVTATHAFGKTSLMLSLKDKDLTFI